VDDFDSDNNGTDDWVSVDSPATISGELNINWDSIVSGLGEGIHYIKVRVRDTEFVDTASTPYNEFESGVVAFTIDTSVPNVSFSTIQVVNKYTDDSVPGTTVKSSSGLEGTVINNDFNLSGTVSDGNEITSIIVNVDGTNYSATVDSAAGTWNRDIAVLGQLDNGNMTIYVTAEDNFGKTSTISLPVVIDTNEPVINPIEPVGIDSADSPNVNGMVNVRGSVTDSSSISDFIATIGTEGTTEINNTGTNYNWLFELNTYDYASTIYGPDEGTTTSVYRVPIDITLYDAGGNRTVTQYHLDIEPDSDNPTVNITSPAGGSSLAGSFLAQGTATDDDAIDRVTLQIDLNNDGDYNDSFDIDGSNTIGDSNFEEESVPVDLTVTNGSWNIELNTNGELNKESLETAGVNNPDGYLTIQAIPYDSDSTRPTSDGGLNIAGEPATVQIYIDSTNPAIYNPAPSSGTIVTDTVHVTANFQDDQQLDNARMQISTDRGSTYQTITNAGGTITIPNGSNPQTDGFYSYDIDVPIDTTDTNIVPDGNGILQVILKVVDQTYKQNSTSLELNADNTPPTGEWDYNSSLPYEGTPPDEVYTFEGNQSEGGSYMVLGSAEDSGTISGIQKIDVYFIKDEDNDGTPDNFYSPVDGTATEITTDDFYNDIYNQNGQSASNVPYPDDTTNIISINTRSERAIYDSDNELGDEDGYQEYLASKGTYDEWFAYFDTTVFPDGPIDVYYVVYDTAQNRSYAIAPGQMSNYPPEINSIEVTTGGELYTGLIKRSGSLYLGVNAADTGTGGGIDSSSYQATLTEKVVAPDGDSTTDGPAIGTTYDIADTAEDAANEITIDISEAPATEFVSGVTYTFTVEVQDTHGNLISKDVNVWVSNTDNTDPTVDIDAFTQNNLGDLGGHIEEAGNSPDGEADLSGSIQITGSAWDDIELSTLELSFNGGSAWVTVPETNITTISTDPVEGNDYSWYYDWNTTNHITGNAAENINIQVRAIDSSDRTGTLTDSGTDPTVTVDVVPYITDIIGIGLDNTLYSPAKRSAIGKYVVYTGAEIDITGYNLPGTDANSVILGDGTELTPSSGNTETITVTLPAYDASGELRVETDTVSSRNHNNSDLPQNTEENAYNTGLSDNRYLAFWDININNTWNYDVIDAVMRSDINVNGNPTGNFSWLYIKDNVDLYFDGNKMSNSFKVSGGDFTETDSGTPIWTFLNDSNSVNDTSNGYSYYGSVLLSVGAAQYGGDTYYAMDWNVDDYVTLGLGNLSFVNGTNYTDTTWADSYKMIRYENIRSVSEGEDSQATNYVFYFDNHVDTQSIAYYSYRIGTNDTIGTAASNDGAETAWYSELEENNENDNEFKYNNGGNQTGIETPSGRVNLTADGNDSSQFDVYLQNGTLYLVYWDQNNNNLMFMYNETPYSDPNANDTTTDGTDFRPVISTFSSGLSGTNYAVKIAYPLNQTGSITQGFNTDTYTYDGGWEVMVAPATTPPKAVQTFIETNGTSSSTAGNIVTGYNSYYLEEATYLDLD